MFKPVRKNNSRGGDKAPYWAEWFDTYLVPVAAAFVTVLVAAQVVTAIPSVRRFVDVRAGRLVETSASVQPQSESARIQLYLSPAQSRPDVEVEINGVIVATFAKPQVSVVIHSGDTLSIAAPSVKSPAVVTVDHDNANLLLPAPGQSVTVTPTAPYASWPTVRFNS